MARSILSGFMMGIIKMWPTSFLIVGRYEAAKESWCYQSYQAWIEDYVKNRSGLVAGDVVNVLFR